MEPALIELHDARPSSVALRTGGECVVCLAHVAVFEPSGSDSFDVVSYEAEFLCRGVTKMVSQGRWTADARISHATLDGEELSGENMARLAVSGKGEPCTRFEIFLEGDTRIAAVSYTHLTLPTKRIV